MVDYKLCYKCFGGFYQGFAYLWVKKSNMTTSKIENQSHLYNAKEGMDDVLLFNEFMSFFKRLVWGGIYQSNHCMHHN